MNMTKKQQPRAASSRREWERQRDLEASNRKPAPFLALWLTWFGAQR